MDFSTLLGVQRMEKGKGWREKREACGAGGVGKGGKTSRGSGWFPQRTSCTYDGGGRKGKASARGF